MLHKVTIALKTDHIQISEFLEGIWKKESMADNLSLWLTKGDLKDQKNHVMLLLQ